MIENVFQKLSFQYKQTNMYILDLNKVIPFYFQKYDERAPP